LSLELFRSIVEFGEFRSDSEDCLDFGLWVGWCGGSMLADQTSAQPR
jgi:hypothetical protein